MKKYIILFNLFIYFGCFSQTHKAIYSLKFVPNNTIENTAFYNEINELAEDNEFFTYFDKTQSYYTSYNVENNAKDMSDAVAMSYDPIKYNYKDNTFQRNVLIDKLHHYTLDNDVRWTITNESQIIDGYNCIKATGIQHYIKNPAITYKVEAWFAPEVNYPIGPADYAGLPGIIIYLSHENYLTFKLEKIIFNENSVDLSQIKYKGDEISKEKYIEFLKMLSGE